MAKSALVGPTTIKTAAYTALPGNLVPVDTTSAGVTITLPSPAPDGALVAVKMVKGANSVTVNAGGSDTFNDSGTGTMTISTLNQALFMQYAAPIGVWYILAGDVAGGGGGGSYLPLAGGDMTGWLSPASTALTFGSTINTNASLGNVFSVTLTGNATMANPTNLTNANGQHIVYEITQDSTGGRSLTWGSAFNFGAGGPPSLSTTGNATDILGFIYNSTLGGGEWLYVGGGSPNKPYQFPVSQYGAKGDGLVANDVQTTSGSTTITSATIFADPNPAGKYIMINGGNGTTSPPLVTTIVSKGTSNQLTVNNAAGATIASGGQAVWATDDTTAINAAVTAAAAFAEANNYYCEVVFDAKIYGVAGLTQTTSPASFNTQIPLPYPNVNGSTQKLVIKFAGAGDTSHCQYWESTIPNLAGTCIVSLCQPTSSVSGTYNHQSVIGGPSGGGAFTGGFANTKAIMSNIMVVCAPVSYQYGFDFRYVASVDVYGSSAQVFTSVNTAALPKMDGLRNITAVQTAATLASPSQAGVGLAMPIIQNNADCDVDSFVCEGFPVGVKMSDTFNARRVACIYCYTGVIVNRGDGAGSGAAGGMTILDLIVGEAAYAIYVSGGTLGTLPVYVNLTTEVIGTGHVNDGSNQLYGTIHWNDTGTTTPTVSGGKNVKLVSDQIPLGYWSGAPAVPATTVSATSYRDAFVSVANGTATVTAVTVDGQTMLSGPGQVVVPAGRPIALTYTGGTPTWTWWNF